MSRIAATFRALRQRGDAALVPYLMAGDPDLGTTLQLMHAVEQNGADLLELGMPFSDPTADGPVIQRADERALRRGGISVSRLLELVRDFRRTSELPIIFFGYYNPVFRYGPERFAADAHAAGMDGCLIVDLPPEEADELQRWTNDADVDQMFLLSPTTSRERTARIVRRARGFVYYVSVTGVTGARTALSESLQPAVQQLRAATNLPIGVGFGISTPEQAAAVSGFADAVVVGSAITKLVEEHQTDGAAVEHVGRFVASLKAVMRRGRRL